MSTTTLERPAPAAAGKPRRKARRSRTLHYVPHADLVFGMEHGIQVKAICGRWFTPCQPAGSGAEQGAARGGWKVCKSCQRVRAGWLRRR